MFCPGFPTEICGTDQGFLLSFPSIKWQKNYKDSSEVTEFQSSPYFYLPANWLVKTWMGNWNTLTIQNSKPHRSWFWEWLETWNHTLHSLQFSTCRKWFVCFFPAPLPTNWNYLFLFELLDHPKKQQTTNIIDSGHWFFPFREWFRETARQSPGNLPGWVGGPIPSPIRETACRGCRTRGKNMDFHLPSNTTSKKNGCLLWRVVWKMFGFPMGRISH